MRHGKTLYKRLLTFMLSVAMVLTSVNVPAFTVRAEESATIGSEDNAASLLSTDDPDGTGDTPQADGTAGAEDQLGGGAEPYADSPEGSTPAKIVGVVVNFTDNSLKVVWGNPMDSTITKYTIYVDGSQAEEGTECREYTIPNKWDPGTHKVTVTATNSNGESDPSDEKEFTVPSGSEVVPDGAPATPNGLVAHYWSTEDNNKGKIYVAWAPQSDATSGFEIWIDSTQVKTTSDLPAGSTTTFCDNTYSQGQHTVELYAVNESGKSAAKTATFELTADQANGGTGGGGEEPGPGDTETKKPNAPSGLVTGYWDQEGANKGKIKVEWNSVYGDGGTPTSWEVKIDSVIVGTEKSVAAYFYENIYDEGTHNVEVVAINSVGRSDPATAQFTLDASQAGSTDGEATEEDIAKLRTLYNSEKTIVDKGNTNYTTATWNVYAEAVEAAGKVVDQYDQASGDGTKPTKKEVNKAYQDLVLAKQNLKEKDPEAKTEVLISEQEEQAFVGSGVTLKSVADSSDFTFGALGTDYTVTINGNNTTSGVSISGEESGKATIKLDGSLFSSAGTYKIQFSKTNAEISPVYQVVYATDSKDKWTLKWQDEFGGTSLDKTKWDYQTGNGSAYSVSGWGNDEEQIYTKDGKNASVADGKLTITAKKESGGGYTSARLRTVTEVIGSDGMAEKGEKLDNGVNTYGKVEAKIKMPAGQGIWPAFWMLPYDSEYGTWAASGEIDIMEARGRLPGEVCGTIHYGGAWPANSSSGKTYYFSGGDTIEQYHIYTIEWDPTEMRWYVDGNLYSTIKNWYSVESESGNYPYPAPFDEEFYVLFNMAVGGTFDSGATTIEVDENGVDMDVDYVRWYQRAEGYDGWDITQPEPDKDASSTAQELLQMHENGNFIKDSDFSAMNTTPITNGDDLKIERGSWKALLIPGNGNGSAIWSKTQNNGKNYLKVNVTNAGSQTYSSQMLQYFPVVKGYSYKISYTAYTEAASQKADVSLKIGGDDDNGWGVYSGNYTDQLTTTPTTYTHSFLMSSDTDPTARFEFNLATSTGTVYLTDVRVEILEGGISEDEGQDDDKEPLGDGNHVYNGGFSNGSDSLLYWHWSNNDDPTKVKVVKENKERRAQINASAGNPVSLWQFGMNMLQDDSYKLTFDIESDVQQDIGLKVTSKDGTEVYAQNNGESDPKQVNQGSSTVTWEFTQPKGKTDTSAKLELTFNGSAKIDNVKLIRTTYNNVDYDKVDLYPLYNGDFTNGTDGWNIWHEKAGYEQHYINDAGQLELYPVAIGADATFYCVGIQSSSMTLTRGVKYKVDFDYWLDADKTYTLELGATQREITLEAGKNHYTSDEFNGSGTGQFTLYLGPYLATDYKLRLDNIVVSAILPEKDGYKQPVNLGQSQRSVAGSAVVVDYAGTMADEWENQTMTYFLKGEKIASNLVTIDKSNNTLTIDGSLFPEEGVYSFYVKAEGYVATKAINLNVLDSSGNLLVNSTFSDGTTGWTFYYADWTAGGSFSVNEDGVAVINHIYDGGESWHFQLSQSLEYPANNYIVEFDAWADVERPIHVQMLDQSGGQPVGVMNSYVNLSTTPKNYKIVWNGVAASDGEDVFNMEFGSMSYDGVTAPNDGSKPYNIYLDNIKFRPLTQADLDAMPFDIASPGAGHVGEDVSVAYTGESQSKTWKAANKKVYVNGEAIDAANVTDNKDTGLTIKGSVFANAGRYSIYVVADDFEETNTIYKNIIGADDNRIFGGDMNDASQWVVYDEDAANLSSGRIARGIYSLNYTAGYFHGEWGIWVNWSSQLKKENISVEGGVPFTLRFEASTDLTGGRDVIIEYGKSGDTSQEKVHVEEGGLKVYDVVITPKETMDDFYVNFLLGPIGSNLEKNEPVPHTLQIDNVTLRTSAKDKDALKAELEAVIAEYEDLTQGEYTDTSWAAFEAALKAAKETAAKDNATSKEISEAINNLRRAAERLTPPTNKDDLQKALDEYADMYEQGDDAFRKAYDYAKEICEDPDATQREIDEALAALKEAYKNLQPDEPTPEPKEGLWVEILDRDEIYYTGSAIKPTINVYHDDQLLTEKTDYTVSYKDNTNAGEATVTVKGKGNYTDSDTETFEIKQKSLLDDDIVTADVINAVLKSNGKLTHPNVTVKYGKKTLSKNKDYVVDYHEDKMKDADGNFIPGAYSVDIVANSDGNYSGTRTIRYDVLPSDITMMSKVSVKLSDSKVDFDGDKTVKPELIEVKKGSGNKAVFLEKDVDYTVDYTGWDEVGKATITLTGVTAKGYYGTKTVTYTVTGTALKAKDLDITGIEKNYTYTGSPIEPQPKVVTKGGEELKPDEHYTVSYTKNRDAGTAKVTIEGLASGGYTGKVTQSFKIDKVDLSQIDVADSTYGKDITLTYDEKSVYTKNGAQQPNVSLTYLDNDLVLDKKGDFTVSYSNNKKVKPGEKSATVKITGKGNYSGTITRNFEVTTPDADTIWAEATDITVPSKLNKLKASLKVYEESTGKALAAGTDYDKTFEYFTDEKCTVSVTEDDLKVDQVIWVKVTLKGNYAGPDAENPLTIKPVSFRLYDSKMKASTFKVAKIPNQTYTGGEIKPTLSVTNKNDETLTEGVDYTVSYTNNIKKGTAKAIITGCGNGYGGTKTVTFKIVAMGMKFNFDAMTDAITNINQLIFN